jgi:hypothetical protein
VGVLAALGACGTAGPRAAGGLSTTHPTSPSSTAPSTSGPPAPAPTLGRLAGAFFQGEGFGQVEPSTVFNGGDPTGLVRDVVWRSWGGPTAVGSGTSDYVGPAQTVAGGTEEPATVVAFDLGTCQGRLMYQAVEWYFPQHGQTFDPHRYEDICTGTFVPSP